MKIDVSQSKCVHVSDDFKPSNEEFNESAIMEITPTNQVTVKYPQSENEGTTDFMYSGTMRQFPKEYFLVIDHVTGEVTLERLTANIQLKRTKYYISFLF